MVVRRILCRIAVSGLVGVVSVVTAVAIWYAVREMGFVQMVAPGVWGLFALVALVAVWCRMGGYARRVLMAYGVLLVVFWVAWMVGERPSNTRDWADDVAHTATAEVVGDNVVVRNVRDFTWRGLTDYDVKWETRTYDLSKLDSVDLFTSTWGNAAIAHTLVSFGFSDGQFLTFSFEIRKEKGEAFSEIAGFFRQYELALIAADERDILYTRTNIRKEEVTRYRVNLTPEQRKELFLSYLAHGNRLAEKPAFYNTVTANCTTVVFDMVRVIVPGIPLDYRVLLSGYLPAYIYDLGGLGKDVPLDVLTERGRITEHVQGLTDSTDYSTIIRRYPIH